MEIIHLDQWGWAVLGLTIWFTFCLSHRKEKR